jgi:hypothetical protein
VALILSQNLTPNPIQNAAPTSQNAAPIKHAVPTPIRHVAPALIKHATPKQAAPLISQNVIPIFSQNAVLIASLFKKKFFQSDSQHLIVCLITISTLSARGID